MLNLSIFAVFYAAELVVYCAVLASFQDLQRGVKFTLLLIF